MKLFFMNHSPINSVHFSKNTNDFVVKEIPLYEFSGNGEHLILHMRKKELTTWQMLKDLSSHCGAKMQDFGYAGLKDKDGMTTQFVSIHKKFEEKLSSFTHEKIKILSTTHHDNKIKIGHLKGNNFFIKLKKVLNVDAKKLINACETIKKEGYPNYFGYQRFGKNGDNYIEGREILEGKRRERNKKLREFLVNAYQSELFNRWLSKRVEISKYFESFSVSEIQKILNFSKEEIKELQKQPQFFKMLRGDVLHHYPHGKVFFCENLEEENGRFLDKDITITGALLGQKVVLAQDLAGKVEDEIFEREKDLCSKLSGARRFAWSFVEDMKYVYKEENAHFEISFTLQKGSYATVVLEEILGCFLEK